MAYFNYFWVWRGQQNFLLIWYNALFVRIICLHDDFRPFLVLCEFCSDLHQNYLYDRFYSV